MIVGDPGAGKTTFIKRMCYIWAQGVLHPEESQAQSVLHPGESQAQSVVHPGESQAQSVVHPGESQAQSVLHPGESQAQSVLHPEESQAQSAVHPGESQSQSVLHPEESQAQSVLHPGESQAESVLHPGESQAPCVLYPGDSQAQSFLHPGESQAESVLHPGESQTESVLHAEDIQRYSLVICIILRLVKDQNTIMDIFTSQLKCLNICEACALLNLLENKPTEILLLLDGYDEYTGRSVIISKVINKEECANILTVTTSRSHAVERLRRHTSQAVDQHVRLGGFNREQIKHYIRQFCDYHELSKDTGKELIRTVFEDRTDILEVAKVPIRTEMICIVWAVYGNLGDTLANLYDMFIIHLITHWETKTNTNQEQSKSKVKTKQKSLQHAIKQNESLLVRIGQLANTWEKYNRLRIVFSSEELEDILGEEFDKVINIGILTKSHPSNTLQESKWSFPHLTIQEYFVAFLLGNDESDTHTSSFITRCKNYRVLRRCEEIFEFLCCKYPSAANKIITQLLLDEKDEQKCQELFDFTCKVYPYYTKNTLDIPLPCYFKLKGDMNEDKMNILILESEKQHIDMLNTLKLVVKKKFKDMVNTLFESVKKHEDMLKTLMKSDTRQKKPNLRHLTIEGDLNVDNENPGVFVKYKRFMNAPYIEGFSVTIKREVEKELVSSKIQKLSKLTSISINSRVSLHSTDHTDILKNISCDRLKDLSVIAPDALEAVADSIHRFKALQKLQVNDTVDDDDDTDRSSINTHEYKILSVLKETNSIKEVSLCVPDLDDRIIQEKFDMKIKLQVKRKTLRKDSLRKAVRWLDFTGGLYKLDLGDNNLKNEGESLGGLMARMTTLRMLDVWNCNIQADTVQAIVQTIKEIKMTSGLHTLYLGRYRRGNDNNLQSGGRYLGELVSLIPDLHTLGLGECKLTDTDLVNMADAVPATTSIHKLNLQGNNPDDSSEGLTRLVSHTPHLQGLAICGKRTPKPIPVLCRAAVAGYLTSLHVLDMSNSQLQAGSLKKLGQHLQYMNTLQVINLSLIEGVEPEDYQHVYSNLPPSIHHLILYNIDLDVYLILDHHHYLIHLHILNVNLSDSDIELLQEVLEQHNPHIHVYNGTGEDTWNMFVNKGEV